MNTFQLCDFIGLLLVSTFTKHLPHLLSPSAVNHGIVLSVVAIVCKQKLETFFLPNYGN